MDSEEAALAAAIISIGHNLGLEIVAEGVETSAQMEFLISHGCERLQGYHFARALSSESFMELLVAGSESIAPGFSARALAKAG